MFKFFGCVLIIQFLALEQQQSVQRLTYSLWFLKPVVNKFFFLDP